MSVVVKRSMSIAGYAACVLVWAVPVQAGLLGTTCTTSATGLVFSNYNPFANTTVSNSSTITVTCSATVGLLGGGTVTYTIALSPGIAASYTPRKMQNGINRLNYNLYTDSAHTIVWGNGVGGTSTVTGSGQITLLLANFSNNATVYGQISAPQTTAVPGTYTDTITVTVTY